MDSCSSFSSSDEDKAQSKEPVGGPWFRSDTESTALGARTFASFFNFFFGFTFSPGKDSCSSFSSSDEDKAQSKEPVGGPRFRSDTEDTSRGSAEEAPREDLVCR